MENMFFVNFRLRSEETAGPLINSASDKPLGTNSRSNSRKSIVTTRLALRSRAARGSKVRIVDSNRRSCREAGSRRLASELHRRRRVATIRPGNC